jgi:hypothetical protein
MGSDQIEFSVCPESVQDEPKAKAQMNVQVSAQGSLNGLLGPLKVGVQVPL